MFYCRYCLHEFIREEVLQDHEPHCCQHGPSVLSYRVKTMLHSISKIITNNSRYHLLFMLILKVSQPRSTQFPVTQPNHIPRNISTINLFDFRMLSYQRQNNIQNCPLCVVVRLLRISFSSV